MIKISCLLYFVVFSIAMAAQDSTAVKPTSVAIEISAGQGLRFGEEAPQSGFGNSGSGLREGFQFDISLYFALKPESRHHIGFKYNSFNKKAGTRGANTFTDDLTLTFYGVGYSYIKPEARNDEWSLDAAIGLMTFYDDAVYNNQKFEIRGNTIGLVIGGSYYFKIVKGVYFGPRMNFLLGAINKVKVKGTGQVEEIHLENPESLVRFDISAGLRFKL